MSYPIIRVDLFPATVTVKDADGEHTHNSARVIVTQDEVHVFVDSSTGPRAAHFGRLDAFEGRNTTGYKVVLADESEINFQRGGGCGCGSRLRGFRPFHIMTHQAQIVE